MSYLKLYSCTIPIKGYNRVLLYDIQRKDSFSIGLEYINILSQLEKGIETVKLTKEDTDLIHFLKSNNLTFKTTEPNNFPAISSTFNKQYIITNLIFNVSEDNRNSLSNNIVGMFDSLSVEAILLNIDVDNHSEINSIIEKLSNSTARSIEISFTNKQKNITTKYCEQLIRDFPRIKRIYTFNTSSDDVQKHYSDCFIISSKQQFNNFKNYRQSKDYLSINQTLFIESQKQHTYFNRKLYIGGSGEIKNAPECEEEFGYIQDIKDVEELKQVIAKTKFQKYWFAHKELIDVCKDCEFRHMCVDNRLPHQRKDSSWYHKLECNYNPYICKWENEDGYQTLKECGVISNENGFSINHEKIAIINNMLWKEEETEDAKK